MMSRTVRVFKLMYIVAGILVSNEEICNTLDRIQIAPSVDVKPRIETTTKKIQRQAAIKQGHHSTNSWLRPLDLLRIMRNWRELLQALIYSFDIWTIPNYVIVCSSSFISRKFCLNSDCDIIYK